ncbi:hypothetical protein CXG81DRAFT_28742 [Caulochytrium protostelioides]|uniref:Peroxin-3 n=1 Tax=Caulochytrium protostelioides TaxID=1555241 RepID=A0A4P9X2I0_9FUNG|nr:hypothetical protein CXG81DRAFT_28742 [Caulochytrium protostelioides]|eukprot:RKO98426.1 hypothetical protein CXG81DRAFT_28742 [Caulochytrium protostelioides]
MAAIAAAGRWVLRQHRAIATIGGIAVSAVWLARLAADQWLQAHCEREMARAAKTNLKRRFEENQRDGLLTVCALFPSLAEHVARALNVEAVTEQLQRSRGAAAGPAGDASASPSPSPSPSPLSPPPPPPPLTKSQKLAAWDALKRLSFTRTVASLYLATLLTLFTHLQLCLLARYLYLDSSYALDHELDHAARDDGRGDGSPGSDGSGSPGGGSTPGGGISSDDDAAAKATAHGDGRSHNSAAAAFGLEPTLAAETERQYLTFSWYLLNVTWRRVVDAVGAAVDAAAGPLALKTPLDADAYVALLASIVGRIELDWHAVLLPPEGREHAILRQGGSAGTPVDGTAAPGAHADAADTANADGSATDAALPPSLALLVDETRDVLESDDFALVMNRCLQDVLAQHVTAMAREAWPTDAAAPATDTDVAASAGSAMPAGVPLASLLPIMARTSQQILSPDALNPYVAALTANPSLKAFCAIIHMGWRESDLRPY